MSRLLLTVVAKDDVMTLPRMLQVLSRRGWRLRGLSTQTREKDTHFTCDMEGPDQWSVMLPGLIAKVPDVKEVIYDK